MVSFHTPLSTRKMLNDQEYDDSSKKRKWLETSQEFSDNKPSKTRNMKSIFDTDLLGTPLPLEWQRCLDIKSGQIYYLNTRTNKRTSKDPRINPQEPPSPNHMSLDLELNLPCGPSSSSSSVGPTDQHHNHHHVADNFTGDGGGSGLSGGLRRSPSWLTCDQGEDQQEMVTAVCKKCHMLVMMLKSTPACPNCKFVHPPDQNPPRLFNNRGLSLLCQDINV